jgi:XTP/dITP diphosphohydrolase
MQVVLASNNLGKISEINTLVSGTGIEVISQSNFNVDEVEEDGLTFVENALKKARHACKLTNLPAIADDSGIVVQALQGAPGIYSARYAGEQRSHQENIIKLLLNLKDVPDEKRKAFFYCCLVFLRHAEDPCPIICEGVWHGKVLHKPQGIHGFGYDPIFLDIKRGCSAAELSPEIKNEVSHRGKAMKQLLHRINEFRI